MTMTLRTFNFVYLLYISNKTFAQLSSLTTIPEDQMVTVQEEVITTVDADPVPKPQPMIEEVMDEGKYYCGPCT